MLAAGFEASPIGAKEPHYSCFFYGTLMNVAILSRVIGRPSEGLETRKGVLQGHVRLHVQDEDYPAVVDRIAAAAIVGRELEEAEHAVQGVVVSGLTADDLRFLDLFEGDEYGRVALSVSTTSDGPSNLTSTSLISAQIYLWKADLSRLSPRIWHYDDFLRDKAHLWIADSPENTRQEYVELEELRMEERV